MSARRFGPSGLAASVLAPVVISAVLTGAAMAQGVSISLEQARPESEAGRAVLVDIREPQEHATGVAPGARRLPMRQLTARLAELPRDRPVLLICNTQS